MFTPPSAWFTGFIPDLPTPFDAADTIDLKAFTALCERQIAAGVPAIVVCETAGEAPTLSPAEQELVIRAAVDVARGRVRIIAGAMSNATSQAIALARRAEAAGADAVMAVVPAYNKPMQEGMLAHFRAIAGATGLPVILHDIPSRTLRPLADETLVRLVESRQFVGLRHGSCDITRPMRLARLLPAGFRLLSGDDVSAFGYIASGGDGAISEVSNIAPDLCRMIFSQVRQGRLQSARYLHRRLIPLITCLSKDSPAALKGALSVLGLMSPATRLPIVPLDAAAQREVVRAFAAIADEELIDRVGA
ncbi:MULTISPECIES: 4-hydroxy-tetrahydrodipicolinate synthase [Bradyrhizobium]|uniref:4-hydroxy-tetrahydrodipicolinate synthase n=1 Tax=Bradyrhizobium diazoefficiens TaxID=1355477 RepID=A0A809ZEQ0_9BRAD|nr:MULTISPECIES: 4-hydroxy-tetrahydrodipicolinate synthase [Bradyrhizobium]MDA9389757.1 dihydrodipicolinate synthase [Bradyrhizobium sp. CCBAU 45394]MDA9540020.1 dihydrodipicolinate synthase [Bradyrhizobium sp. CCBAU 21362]WLA76039.1 4-hydroxy-tetrahydrodipicolinate synthase [Bradyrhizobium diazoefficiens]BCE24667.1 4-hydroxy-tetrahydrodipicolinate synthase [Bradyrhizobium diazoefficiens]BCE50926.1 4-hydroxy-tetrahydrodipicolinate synthase [Bradyrhizobium diazoefficiens]